MVKEFIKKRKSMKLYDSGEMIDRSKRGDLLTKVMEKMEKLFDKHDLAPCEIVYICELFKQTEIESLTEDD